MKPLIGITTELAPDRDEGRGWFSTTLITGYCESVAAAGGLPVSLPLAHPATARETLERLDGLILSGGRDIPPEAFGQAPHPALEPMLPPRWPSERLWLETALDLGKPVLGICLGMQVMAVVAGAPLIQDIPSQWPEPISHSQPGGREHHRVTLQEGTRLAALAPAPEVEIVSSHHQAVAEVPSSYRLAALSPDGIIEAIERLDGNFCIGVQWHPERSPEQPNWLLDAFVRQCKGM
jgi:putative glutamine amidotransferase